MHSIVIEGHSLLAFDNQTASRKVTRQHGLIDGLQQSRPQLAVDFDGGINHRTGYSIQPLRVPRASA